MLGNATYKSLKRVLSIQTLTIHQNFGLMVTLKTTNKLFLHLNNVVIKFTAYLKRRLIYSIFLNPSQRFYEAFSRKGETSDVSSFAKSQIETGSFRSRITAYPSIYFTNEKWIFLYFV